MVVTAFGLGLTGGAGYFLVRGPFFGGPGLDDVFIIGAAGAVVVGMIVLALGATKLVRIHTFY